MLIRLHLTLLGLALFGALTACASAGSDGLPDGGASLDAAADAGGSDDAATTLDGGDNDAGVSDAGCDLPSASGPGMSQTQFATLAGAVEGDIVRYLGVPYAAPPTGALRFADPQPPACATQVLNATQYGPACPQLDNMGNFSGDEDCLFLNVWAPANPPPVLLPVLFFIHGGGNNQGSASPGGALALYDGKHLAAHAAVVVTINYRLGALGFAAHPTLDGESPRASSSNYALLDQIAALRWVRANAAAFGGDPDRILIFGESAGGLDTCLLYISPLARGLFARALIESGGCAAPPKSSAVTATERLIAGAGCDARPDPIACLREKTAAEILAGLPPVVTGLSPTDFAPVIDGAVITAPPMVALMNGDHANVPLVLGTNAHETAQMVPPRNRVTTEAQFLTAARNFLAPFGLSQAQVNSILAVYPVADYPDPHAALVALTTDVRWSCPGRAVLRNIAGAPSPPPLYRYYFTQALDPIRAPMQAANGAFHGLELLFVFGAIADSPAYTPSQAELDFSALLQRQWTRFAASGDPNGDPDPVWPSYDALTDSHLVLSTTASAAAGVRTVQCDAIAAAL